ncbi:cytochrome-c peroxidase [Vibrio fluvialis]|uniref:cytochrome-c peroxidase n=1 Tax=Vibrio fluvialis TaxID=676 RepID=UPI0028DE35AE|nr:cytochrome-c peroxidase [Vibrio fluvialis]MDT8869188.1 cytochrome-c peroxidase [Vibrio fluvialis]MDT8876841.1 cytochrome-c peroxidase [Vibrio fluvialis]
MSSPFLLAALALSSSHLTPEAELGRYLFHDVRLSVEGNRSCAICHSPNHGWANRFSRTPDIYNQLVGLNTPSLLNVAEYSSFTYHMPNVTNLATAISRPLFSAQPAEMGMTPELLSQRLQNASHLYRPLFHAAYQNTKMSSQQVLHALSAYVSTIRSTDTAWHRYMNGKTEMFTPLQQRGWALFAGEKLRCTQCHGGPLLNTPVDPASQARSVRIPSLINVTQTGPWGFNGRFATLDSVIEHNATHYDHNAQNVALRTGEKQALLVFLQALETPPPHAYTNVASPFCALVLLKGQQDAKGCIPPYRPAASTAFINQEKPQ